MMYNRELEEKILAADGYSAFAKIIRDFMKDAAYNWFNALEEKERKALVMLEFDPAVATTMMFFGKYDCHRFSDEYTDALEAILTKAEQLAEQEDKLRMFGMSGLFEAAWNTRKQAEEERKVRDRAARIAREFHMDTGIRDLENILVKNSGDICEYKSAKYFYSRNLRKAFLHDILDYLRANYNGGPCNKERDE